jgi:hypothetical protein
MWDKEGDVGEDNSQKISKKDALPLVVQWYDIASHSHEKQLSI